MLVTEKFDVINIGKLGIFIVVLIEDSFAPVLFCSSKLWNQLQSGWLLLIFEISLVPESMTMIYEPGLFWILCIVKIDVGTCIDPSKWGIDLSLNCGAFISHLNLIIKTRLSSTWSRLFAESTHCGWLSLKLRHSATWRIIIKEWQIIRLSWCWKHALILNLVFRFLHVNICYFYVT